MNVCKYESIRILRKELINILKLYDSILQKVKARPVI